MPRDQVARLRTAIVVVLVAAAAGLPTAAEPPHRFAPSGPEIATAQEPSADEDAADTSALAHTRIEPHPDIAVLQRLTGDWRIETEFLVDGERRAGPAAHVEYRIGLNGLGLVKTDYHPSPGGAHPVFSSTTIYTWAPHQEAVVAASNNSLGNRKMLTGRRTAVGFVFTQEGRLFGGRPGHNEIRLILHSNDHYEVRQAYCPDGPESCRESYWAVGTRLGSR